MHGGCAETSGTIFIWAKYALAECYTTACAAGRPWSRQTSSNRRRKMTSTSSKKRSKKLQTFSGDYTKKWSCIVPSKRNTNSACCTHCSSDFGIGHGGSNDIQVHLKSVKHRTAAAEASSNSRSHDIAQFFVAKDNSVTNAEVKFTQFLIEHNIAFSAADHLSQLVKNAFPDSKIARASMLIVKT